MNCVDFGLKVGDKVVYTHEDNDNDPHSVFEIGDILTLVEDDGSDSPKFKNQDGHRAYLWLTVRGWKMYEESPNKDYKPDFQVGDRVVDVMKELEGTVMCIDSLSKYCVEVEFSDGKRDDYTDDGRVYDNNVRPSLYPIGTTLPQPNIALKERCKFVKGQLVAAWTNHEDFYTLGTFIEKNADGYVVKSMTGHVAIYKNCRALTEQEKEDIQNSLNLS